MFFFKTEFKIIDKCAYVDLSFTYFLCKIWLREFCFEYVNLQSITGIQKKICFWVSLSIVGWYLGKGVNERGKIDKGHWKLKLQLCPCSTNIPEIRIIISLFINKSPMRSSFFHLPVTVSRDRGTCHPPPIGMHLRVCSPLSTLKRRHWANLVRARLVKHLTITDVSIEASYTSTVFTAPIPPLLSVTRPIKGNFDIGGIERAKEWKYRCFLEHQLMDDCEKTSPGGRSIIVYRPGSWNCQLTLLSYLCISFSCRFARIDVVMFRGLYKGHHG